MRRQGMVVEEFGPWKVVDPGPRAKQRRFVVVDTSGERAVKVYGPASLADCRAYSRTSLGLLSAVHGQVPEEGRS